MSKSILFNLHAYNIIVIYIITYIISLVTSVIREIHQLNLKGFIGAITYFLYVQSPG